MKTPPDERLAQDLQNKTSITANKGRNKYAFYMKIRSEDELRD